MAYAKACEMAYERAMVYEKQCETEYEMVCGSACVMEKAYGLPYDSVCDLAYEKVCVTACDLACVRGLRRRPPHQSQPSYPMSGHTVRCCHMPSSPHMFQQ